jgi:hypothetical protein
MNNDDLQWVSIEKLRPWAKNPRKNNKAVLAVANSITKFGFGAPIVARKNGEVIAGHTRLKAAIALTTADTRQGDDIRVELLGDIAAMLDSLPDRVTPSVLVERLNGLDGRPWAELGKGGLTANRLGRYLQSFGVKTSVAWKGSGNTERGYDREALRNVGGRYSAKMRNAPSETHESPVKQASLHITDLMRNTGGIDEPMFSVVFRGPLELQAELLMKLRSIANEDNRIDLEIEIVG